MSDYIDRQAAICAIEEYADRLQVVNWKENPGVPYKAHALNWVINTLRDLPSAEVEPVKHGKWITIDDDNHRTKCSICGSPAPINKVVLCGEVMWEDNSPINYCPNCGAKIESK